LLKIKFKGISNDLESLEIFKRMIYSSDSSIKKILEKENSIDKILKYIKISDLKDFENSKNQAKIIRWSLKLD